MKGKKSLFWGWIILGAGMFFALNLFSEEKNKLDGWPAGVKEIYNVSTADKTKQPAIFYHAETKEPAPLLVALHTWSGDYLQKGGAAYAKWCKDHKWHMIHPNFRGKLVRPEATGSDLVYQDILDAVTYAKKHANVDEQRIYLVGLSGGGYTGLVMTGRAPQVWTAVSVWVPISDLKAWYNEGHHHGALRASCGGIPGSSPKVDEEYRRRSPVTYLSNAVGLPLDINAGIRDKVVPCSHSLRAFNLVAEPKDRISEKDIKYFAEKMAVPPHLAGKWEDSDYKPKILFRRKSGNARVTIFDGGHSMSRPSALKWLSKHKKMKTKVK